MNTDISLSKALGIKGTEHKKNYDTNCIESLIKVVTIFLLDWITLYVLVKYVSLRNVNSAIGRAK